MAEPKEVRREGRTIYYDDGTRAVDMSNAPLHCPPLCSGDPRVNHCGCCVSRRRNNVAGTN